MPPKLDIPEYPLKSKATDRGEVLFDPVRGKYVSSAPEEIVRQRIIQYLSRELGWPLSLMRSEHGIKLHGLSKRVDLSLHDSSGLPIMIIECKAPSISIDQRTFEQAARYNIVMKVPYLLLTNGLLHFCCKVDHSTGKVSIVDEIPPYTSMPLRK